MEVLIITATYNEKENITQLINDILALDLNADILVVDDSSPDGTGELVDSIAGQNGRVHILHRPGKLGYGSAFFDGFRWAMEHEAKTVFTMDADFSHNPQDLPRLYDSLRDSDMVIGSRYVKGGKTVNWPLKRVLLSSFANKYIRAITGMPAADNTSGFRGYREQVLRTIPLEEISSKGYSFLVELVFHVFSKGFRIKEVPITFEDRRLGKSKMSGGVIFESIWLPWRLKLRRIRSN